MSWWLGFGGQGASNEGPPVGMRGQVAVSRADRLYQAPEACARALLQLCVQRTGFSRSARSREFPKARVTDMYPK